MLDQQRNLCNDLREYGIVAEEAISIPAYKRQYLSQDGSIQWEEQTLQRMTSWDTIYRQLRNALLEFKRPVSHEELCRYCLFRKKPHPNTPPVHFESSLCEGYQILSSAYLMQDLARIIFSTLKCKFWSLRYYTKVMNDSNMNFQYEVLRASYHYMGSGIL